MQILKSRQPNAAQDGDLLIVEGDNFAPTGDAYVVTGVNDYTLDADRPDGTHVKLYRDKPVLVTILRGLLGKD